MVLPVVLVLVVALTVFATAILALAGTERVVESQSLAYLEGRHVDENLLARRWAAASDGREIPRLREWGLRAGFVLVELRTELGTASRFGVGWRVRTDRILSELPWALESGNDPPSSGIRRLDDCSSKGPRPLVRVRSDDSRGSVSETPDIGLLDPPALLGLAQTDLGKAGNLPRREEPASFRVADGAVVREGWGRGLLVSAGDLTLRGTARFEGLVVVPGTLRLEGESRIVGVALVGAASIEAGGARILGCPARVAWALELPELQGLHPVPDGNYLGRF
ncbi:MAG: hypothetical protein WD013_02395 [Gemmatimonadota bacterium]